MRYFDASNWFFLFIVFISSKTLAAPSVSITTENSLTTLLPENSNTLKYSIITSTSTELVQKLNDEFDFDYHTTDSLPKTPATKRADKLDLELASIAYDIGNRLNDVIINEERWYLESANLQPNNTPQRKKLHKRDTSDQTTNKDELLNEIDSDNNNSTDHDRKSPDGHGNGNENHHDKPQNSQHWSAGLWNHTLSKTSAVLGPVQHVFNTIRRAQNPPGVHHGNGRDDVATHHHSSVVSRPGDHHSIETEEERLKIEDSLGFHVLEFFGTIAGLLWGLFSNIQRIFSSSTTSSSS